MKNIPRARVLFLSLLFLAGCDEPRHPGEALFPIRQDHFLDEHNTYGYINAKGRICINTCLWMAYDFSDGVAWVEVSESTPAPFGPGEGRGLIDENGSWVIKPSLRYEQAGPFAEGRSVIKIGDLYGYIDKMGRDVVAPSYTHAGDFSGGLAAVEKDGRWGYIDLSGHMAIEPVFESGGPFEEGYAAANKDGKCGLIDRTGKWVIPPQYDALGAPHEGWMNYAMGTRLGLRTLDGEEISDPSWEFLRRPSEGLVAVVSGGKWGMISVRDKGKVVLPFQWDRLGDFAEGLIPFERGNQSGFINQSGRVQIDLGDLETCDSFQHGLAYVRKSNSHEGYVNLDGKWVYRRNLR